MIDQSSFLFGFPLFSKSSGELLTELTKQLKSGKKLVTVFTPNPEQIVQSISNSSFGKNLAAADVRIPDGIGLVWASRLFAKRTGGVALRERVAGSDLVSALLSSPSFQGSALVVGGRAYAGRVLQTPTRTLTVGQAPLLWTAGYADVKNQSAKEEQSLVELLKKLRPSIVFVAFGAPDQEEWVIAHRELLESLGTKLAIPVGGAFDMLLGLVPRAPKWLRKLGLEWLFRLVQQPWRWRRQLRLVTFSLLVLREVILSQFHRPSSQT
ncbi:MAG: WecB/TagA/CpsF family glycosyltransferase [bacterium]|nr:WecB/TagA/CpsF family glycosyltransferase [bacterium]